MILHSFIAMLFGTEPGAEGNATDFNRIYVELLTALILRHVTLDHQRDFFRTTGHQPMF